MIEFLSSSEFDIIVFILSIAISLTYTLISVFNKKEIKNMFLDKANDKIELQKKKVELNLQAFDDIKVDVPISHFANSENISDVKKDKSKKVNKSSETTVIDLTKQHLVSDKETEDLVLKLYKQALKQSTIQFWVNIVTSVIGFLFIIFIVIISGTLEWYENLVKILPGIIIECVSALFISQSKETRKQASTYLNRLRKDRQYEKSLEIVKFITDTSTKDATLSRIALHFAGIDTEEEKDTENKSKVKKKSSK